MSPILTSKACIQLYEQWFSQGALFILFYALSYFLVDVFTMLVLQNSLSCTVLCTNEIKAVRKHNMLNSKLVCEYACVCICTT